MTVVKFCYLYTDDNVLYVPYFNKSFKNKAPWFAPRYLVTQDVATFYDAVRQDAVLIISVCATFTCIFVFICT